MKAAPAPGLDRVVARLVGPALTGLADDLAGIRALGAHERDILHQVVANVLHERVLGRVGRALLLELHAARLTGRLTAPDPAGRWDEWIELACEPSFRDVLAGRYPTLLPRLGTLVDNQCRAGLTLARRFVADRAAIGRLTGSEPELTDAALGAGDSHNGGQTVALIGLPTARVVYKPRSLAVDAVLAGFLRAVLPDEPDGTRIRVPEIVLRDGYGWAAHVEHRYCADDGEFRAFYRGLGHWLAVTRLFGASDLHAENLIAAGPVPVVVDCETLFTPRSPARPSGHGQAMDQAIELLRTSVLRTGLLPGRGVALGFRGADMSAAGALPDEQPEVEVPVIVDAGTDRARIGTARITRPPAKNHPGPEPRLREHWRAVVDGFDELNHRLTDLDHHGRLAPLLSGFADCPIRIVVRDTVVYGELGAMLWHPSALHDEPAARRRAADLLAGHAANSPGAPAAPETIQAEIGDLLVGDVPFFGVVAGAGQVTGPGGTATDEVGDLVGSALVRWRDLDAALDREVIECAVVSAYRDEVDARDVAHLRPSAPVGNALDRRRRTLAAAIVRTVIDRAISAPDGTVAWISPTLGPTGIAIQPLALDIYGGLPGVAVLLAAHQSEVAGGRAEPVAGSADLLDRTVHTLRTMDDRVVAERREHPTARPDPAGGYVGHGSRIWSWLLLARSGAVEPDEALRRAVDIAGYLPESVAADEFADLLIGMAGAVVPLLRLAEATGDERWRGEAIGIGDRLVTSARTGENGARWAGPRSPDGIGGFAHGSAGIGWALARLGTATDDARFGKLAEAAFAYQEALFLPGEGGWRDPRKPVGVAANWCYGCDGMGVVAADLGTGDPYWHGMLERAAASAWSAGMGVTHTLCHGDLGSWEVLDLAVAAGVAPAGVTRQVVDGYVLSSLEQHGPRWAMNNGMFRPGLLAGAGGIAYQLLRMHPEATLPSLLLPDPPLPRPVR
ncbi:type 2 lanthipeptide synthetase LanM family protein [Polymorphospora lycopeni]|uniref:Type 2 lanthipeptide synthetase LanM family protein n=1 Tax=Polymorphospora lycopeni TaxID=3140240 RepID=A0ABV5CIE6_9ACTN